MNILPFFRSSGANCCAKIANGEIVIVERQRQLLRPCLESVSDFV